MVNEAGAGVARVAAVACTVEAVVESVHASPCRGGGVGVGGVGVGEGKKRR